MNNEAVNSLNESQNSDEPGNAVEIEILKPQLSSEKYLNQISIKYYPVTNTHKNYEKRNKMMLLEEDKEYLMVFFNSLREHSCLSIIRNQLCIFSIMIVLLALLTYINLKLCLIGYSILLILFIFKGRIEVKLYNIY